MHRVRPVCLLLMILSSLALTQNFISFPVGDFWQFPDARTLGLAGAGSVSNGSPGALIQNPAALVQNPHRIEAILSTTARNFEERRSFPIYNRIPDIIGQGVYVINDHWYTHFQGAAQYNFEKNRVPFLRSVAVGAFNELDQNFDYLEEVRENIFGDGQIAYNEIAYNGRLTRYSAGLAFNLAEGLDLGLQAGILKGDLDQRRSIEFVNDADAGSLDTSTRLLNNTPLVASLGAIYAIDSRVTVGGHIRFPYTADYATNLSDTSGSGNLAESVEYPMQLNVGFEYRGRQELLARLNIDFSYEWWANTSYRVDGADIANGFEDAIVLRTAIEHIFFNQIPFRVGLQYRTAYQNRSSARTLISAGTGFMGDNWQVDLAGGLSKLTYTYPDLFDDTLFGGDRSQSLIDDVEERYFFGIVTLRAFID